MTDKNTFLIRKLAGGYWKGYRLDNPNLAIFGILVSKIIDKLEEVEYNPCDNCDPIKNPQCNKCIGS
jgi:hypothetical protein